MGQGLRTDNVARCEAFGIDLHACTGPGCYLVASDGVDGDGLGHVKVGMTSDLGRRLYGIASAAPSRVHLVGWWHCGSAFVAREVERFVLGALRQNPAVRWLRGEWFAVTPENLAVVVCTIKHAVGLFDRAIFGAVVDRLLVARGWRVVGIEAACGLSGRCWYLALLEGYFSGPPVELAPRFPVPISRKAVLKW